MTDERQDLLARREILMAYIEVLGRLDELVKSCSTDAGAVPELRSAVQEAFGLSPIAADAVLSMQVRRFTPIEPQKIQEEFAHLNLR